MVVSKKQAAGVGVIVLSAVVATLKACPEDTTVAPKASTHVDAGVVGSESK